MKKDLSLPFTKPKVAICGDKSVNCIYSEKNTFISIHSEITWLQLLKRCIRVSSCNLQKEHKGEGVFTKLNSVSLRYNTLLSILYWKALQHVLILISLGRRYINFKSLLIWLIRSLWDTFVSWAGLSMWPEYSCSWGLSASTRKVGET